MKKKQKVDMAALEQGSVIAVPAEATIEPHPSSPEALLAAKRKELEGVANAIGLYARGLAVEERARIDDLESRMEYRLKTLVTASQMAEAEIKLETMRQVLEIIKKPVGIITK